MRSSICECGPDQKIIEICENIPFLEKSLHSVVVLEQVLMQNIHTECSLGFLLPSSQRL